MGADQELQTIPARHGTATFVPAGQTIKIVNTSGTQVIDTWAFALPTPPKKGDGEEPEDEKKDGKQDESTNDGKSEEKPQPKPPATPKKRSKNGMDLPSQEEAEQATKEGLSAQDKADGKDATPQKSSWSSYVPTLGLTGGKKQDQKSAETEQEKNSRGWMSYFPSGKGYSSYIPSATSGAMSAFTQSYKRDPKKSYTEQLTDFSRTPVGAAGMAALTGSGYAGSLYAGYSAYNASNVPEAPPMEFLSMPHCRAATLHLVPRPNDTLVSNLREPMMTLVEDTSPGVHDTLIAACDPPRYKGLGVKDWEKHGSCAENLVFALKELNERAGLKGVKAVGADVTINQVPAPLNLFMNIPWNDDGEVAFKGPRSKAGDYVRLRAERDVVVVMSACPQDILDINNKDPTDAHFLVEESGPEQKKKAAPAPKRPTPKKLGSSRAQSTAGGDAPSTTSGAEQPKKKPVPQRRAPGAEKPSAPSAKAPSKAPVKAAPAKNPDSEANGTEAPPVERKKPKKLAVRRASEQVS